MSPTPTGRGSGLRQRGDVGDRAAGRGRLAVPVPRPRQVFAIGLNYRSHAEESGMNCPTSRRPSPSSRRRCRVRSTTSGSSARRRLGGRTRRRHRPARRPGRRGRRVVHIAGLTVGQDISDRTLQFAAGASSRSASPPRLRPDGFPRRRARLRRGGSRSPGLHFFHGAQLP